ncbi:MAG: hypothetical protein E7661_01540 [Ruminococcaceae bacterium]|nr:hypothetical protein [Oscillospiraceae bacterium]
MRKKRLSPTLGLGFMIAGVVFLVSPMLAVVDVLPDFIGYALIMKGIYCLSDMDDRVSEARGLFRRMVILGLARFAAIFFIFGMASPTERPTLQLLCAFAFAVLDCITLIPAWKSLCNGFIYLGTRHDSTAIFDRCYPGRKIRSNKTLTERTFSYTLFFLVAREVMSVLPELAVLNHESGGADAGNRTMVYEFIGLMRGMSAVLVLILGIVWLARIIPFLRHLMKDRPFFDKLCHKYETEVLTRPELFARRSVKLAMVFLCVGLCFTLDFFLDDVCVTPDFMLGILSIIGLLILRKHVKTPFWKGALAVAGAYILLTAGEWILQLGYFKMSDGGSAYRHAEVYEHWMTMNYVRGVTVLCGILLLFMLVMVLMMAVNQYTGFSVTAYDSAHPNARVAELHKALHSRLWVAFGLGVAASLASLVHMLVLPVMDGSLWELWIFADVVLSGVFVAFFIHTVSVIFEQIDYKYMLS